MPEPVPLSDTSSHTSRFLIGRDSRGRWVARDERGLCGGLFVNRVAAVGFAMRETGRRPQSVIMVTGVLELDMTSAMKSADQAAHHASSRRAA